MGAAFLVTMVPLRILLVAWHRRVALGEPVRTGSRIGVAMLPTLVFTIVIAEILRDIFLVTPAIFGGLILYTLINTLVPGFALRLRVTDMDVWHGGDWTTESASSAPSAAPRAPSYTDHS